MKKKLKIGLAISALFCGIVMLSSCTANFCNTKDQSRMLFAYENGVTAYYDKNDLETPMPEGAFHVEGFDENVYCTIGFANSGNLMEVIKKGKEAGITVPNTESADQLEFFVKIDQIVLQKALSKESYTSRSYTDLLLSLHDFGYLKFYDESGADNTQTWNNFDNIWNEAANYIISTKGIDYVPSTDFKNLYKTTISNSINANRSCLVTDSFKNGGDFGIYGPNKEHVYMEPKNYGDGWNKGFFEGLLVWPIGAFIDTLAQGFGYQVGIGNEGTPTNGVPQLLAILVVTVVIRLFMVLVTFKQTIGNAKMTELQPEITKIQAKYPNSNTNKYEKQRMAEEMQKLYKKNHINPLSTIFVLIIQFPIFICVWGALSGSAVLTNGTFLGLRLGESISSVLFNGVNWTAEGGYGAVTALFLFILMGVAQAISMLLPQWMQKAKAKKVAKLGKNPAQQSQNNKMKWVTYIMLAMIIIMGFSLVSAMGVYWLVGALFSIAQTLITQKVIDLKSKKAKGAK